MPDFQQFADAAAKEVGFLKLQEHFGLIATITAEKRPTAIVFCEQAERHARLLQQIWEWANKPAFYSFEPPTDPHDMGEQQGEVTAKAHVRSLLVGQQESE